MWQKVRSLLFRVLPIMVIFPWQGFASAAFWEPLLINTAAEAGYLSPQEKMVILEINRLRSDPAEFARLYLEPLSGNYKGLMLQLPGRIMVRTKEGVAALTDAIRVLKVTAPLPLLFPDPRLSQASRDHRVDQSVNGGTGHTGSNGTEAQSRIRKYGRINKAFGENIFYGEKDPRMVVIHLLIDDGHPGRGHRLNLLDRDYRLIGVATGSHPVWKHICVMNFADVIN